MSSRKILAENVRRNIRQTYLTQKSYAKEVDVPLNTFARILKGENITLDLLDHLAEGMGIDPWDLIKEEPNERS